MRLLRFSVLLLSLVFLEQIAAQIPVDFVPLCAHKCLHKSVPYLCPHSVGFFGLRHCLCKEKKSDQLRQELSKCLKNNSSCSDSDTEKTLKFTHTVCEAHFPPFVSTSSSTSSPTSKPTSSHTGKANAETPTAQAQRPKADREDDKSSSSLSSGVSAGIGVAVAIGVLAIIAVAGYIIFKRRRRAQQEQLRQSPEIKHWFQDNRHNGDSSRVELGGQEMAVVHDKYFEASPNNEPPPAYVHEKEGVVPISELASPSDISPSIYGGMSQVHELPSPPDTNDGRDGQHLYPSPLFKS